MMTSLEMRINPYRLASQRLVMRAHPEPAPTSLHQQAALHSHKPCASTSPCHQYARYCGHDIQHTMASVARIV